jgi:hypothetical protein
MVRDIGIVIAKARRRRWTRKTTILQEKNNMRTRKLESLLLEHFTYKGVED